MLHGHFIFNVYGSVILRILVLCLVLSCHQLFLEFPYMSQFYTYLLLLKRENVAILAFSVKVIGYLLIFMFHVR